MGEAKAEKTTKIYAAVDGLGNPLYVKLTAGQVQDSMQAVKILSQLNIKGSNVLADKAYGTKEIREYIRKCGGEYTIPPKSNTVDKWEYDYHIYKERHLVEFFLTGLRSSVG